MNMKRIALLAAMLLIAISSLTIVSAGWFGLTDAAIRDVNGEKFHVPEEMLEIEHATENGTYGNDTWVEKSFYDPLDDSRNRPYVTITVFSSKTDYNLDANTILGNPNSNSTGTVKLKNNTDYENKTIHSQNGLFQKNNENTSRENYRFIYSHANKYVIINTNNETLLNETFVESS